jgi:hypothetical protein
MGTMDLRPYIRKENAYILIDGIPIDGMNVVTVYTSS